MHDGSVGGQGGYAPGAYVRTGWTASYTCRTATTDVAMCPRTGDSPNDTPPLALDGKYATRWSTDEYEQDLLNAMPTDLPIFFTVDMKDVLNVSKIVMQPGCKDDFDVPGTLEVYASVDGTNLHYPSSPTITRRTRAPVAAIKRCRPPRPSIPS